VSDVISPRIAIIGAGVIGLSIGWRLAQRGAAVTIFERDAAGQGASHAAAGMLAACAEVEPGEERLFALNRQSQALWPAFAAELEAASGMAVDLRREGTLVVALNADERARLQHHLEFQHQLGLTLDVANFYWWGHPLQDLYGIYEKFAPRVVHTHCKNIHYPDDKKNVRREMGWEYAKYNCPIYDGDIDFKRLTGILRQANYSGDLCVEDESLSKFPETERAEVIKKEIAVLKKLA